MWVYKFVELNPFGNITYVLPNDLQHKKSDAHCSPKCDELFCNKVKSRSTNKEK
jgi:hypothetical protein